MNKVKEVSVGDVWKRGEFNTTPQKKETKGGSDLVKTKCLQTRQQKRFFVCCRPPS